MTIRTVAVLRRHVVSNDTGSGPDVVAWAGSHTVTV
jgi:hypothetical protein